MTSKSGFKFNPNAAVFKFGDDDDQGDKAAPKVEAPKKNWDDEDVESPKPATDAPAKKVEAVPVQPKPVEKPVEKPAEPAPAVVSPKESPTAKEAEKPKQVAPKKEAKKEEPKSDKKDKGTAESDTKTAPTTKKGPNIDDLKVHDDREPLNIVFIGHVDAGKSTISGQILLQTGQVDERTIEKYKKEAIDQKRESWYVAYIMDTNDEERAKGKTVEVGRAYFSTKTKRYTLLDCPGHKNFVPNMIGGTAQADVGVLVISARKGEFETGFEKGGQTREHAMLAKTLGIRRLVVVVNKMDDPTVQWDQNRYDEIEKKISPFLKQWGYNLEKEVTFMPIAGLKGYNMKDPIPKGLADWYKGKTFFDTLDSFPPLERDPKAPLRIPVITRYKDMGVVYVLGKVESGTLVNNSELILMPNAKPVQVQAVLIGDQEVEMAKPGENVTIRVKGVEEEELQSGFVLSSTDKPVRRSKEFEAQVVVLPLLDHKPIITTGYQCVLHIHSLAMECAITKLMTEVDKKTGQPAKKPPTFVKAGSIMTCRILCDETIAVESFKDFPQLGRFTLRDEGKTIGIGKILRIKDYKKEAANA